MRINHRLFTLTGGVRRQITGTVALGLLITGTYIGQSIFVAVGVSRIFSGASWSTLTPIVLWILVLIALRAGLLWLREISSMATASAVKYSLRRRLYAHLLALGPGYLEHTRTGTVQSILVDGVESLEAYMGYYLPQALVALIGPFFILVYLLFLDPLVGVLTCIGVILVPFAPNLWNRVLGEYGQSHWRAYSALNAQFLDSMQGMTTLKAFSASQQFGQKLREKSTELYRATMAQLSISLIQSGIVNFAMSAGTALAVAIGAVRLTQGALAFPELIIILFLVGECFRPLTDLSNYWHQGYMGYTASKSIFDLLDTKPTVSNVASPVIATTTTTRAELTFHQVSFAYADGTRPALHDLSFTVAPHATVALVGRSGAGKSTVVALALRFFDPQRGKVLLDGHDIRTYSLESLRGMMAVVSQDTYLFHGTIADNLRLGKPDATQEELAAAAHAANIHSFITSLPDGYATAMGERGLRLSGGERQRIAIARSLLKDAPILILDEATSSVDAANEAAIQDALDRLTANRTTLVIAHRLSTVIQADRIVVLEQGQMVETGSHTELLTQQGAYAQLVAAQQGGL